MSPERASRFASRMRVLPRALARRFLSTAGRAPPAAPRRVLVAHYLLAGDVLMLAPLLAKLRARHPDAQIVLPVRRALLPLFAPRPWGVRAIAYDPAEPATLEALFAGPGYDLACVPGDNRHSWLAAAAGARWIVAFEGDRPAYKNWPVDELRPMPTAEMAWSDMAALLAEGAAPPPYTMADWPAPPCAPFERPQGRYAVLHVEASTPLKHWEEAKWRLLAEQLADEGFSIVWSAGPQGGPLLARIDPGSRFPALGHKLDLAQLWHLVAAAALLVCPDTSVLHIGRLAGTPTVALFGPSSARLFGPGEFWRDMPYRDVTVEPFPCRDQQLLFKRRIAWIRRCQRTLSECPAPRCMHAIDVERVAQAGRAIAR